MKLSVVIATYNRRHALFACLSSLFDQTVPTSDYEVVVVVDGSSDGTTEMLDCIKNDVRIVIYCQKNAGQAAARNAGARLAKADILLFLDDDLICDRGLIAAHLAAHRGREPAVVCGPIHSTLGSSPSLAETSMHQDLDNYYARLNEDPCPRWPENAWFGPNCSIPRSTFLEEGGFDTDQFPRRWEDVDLGLRLWKSKTLFCFAVDAVVTHSSSKESRQSWADTQEDGASMVRLCRKHPEMRTRSVLFALMQAATWKRAIARIASADTVISHGLLTLCATIMEKLAGTRGSRKIVNRLFGWQQMFVVLRGARREAGSWRTLIGMFNRPLPVLLYHHIGTPNEQMQRFSLTVSPRKFKRQMGWLAWRGYSAITPAQWLAWCAEGKPLPRKPILLTFDDGYSDLLENAFPVLEKHGFGAAVFVITQLTRAGRTWEGMQLMTFPQTQLWSSRRVEFGGHTRSHPDLTMLSEEQARTEINGSKYDLVEAGIESASFAYPFGSFNDRVRRAVEGAFAMAFTCDEGLNNLNSDLLTLRRTMVHPGDTLLDLEFRLALGRSPLDLVRSRLRIRTRLGNLWKRVALHP